jgi:rubredoxin-NAD+ reductase
LEFFSLCPLWLKLQSEKGMMMKPIVVLGSGLAGYTVVRELRKLNADIAITLVTRDSGDYYSKPMLSNALAQGKNAENLVLTDAQKMAQQLNFTLLAHTEVIAINAANKSVQTDNGTLEYEKLVLAVGADAIKIPLQGNAVHEVLSVNNLADYAQFRSALNEIKKTSSVRAEPVEASRISTSSMRMDVAIMGGGLIGCEFANDLAAAGYSVTVIDPAAYPLASLMPQTAGEKLLEPLQKIGVTWRLGTAVQAVDKLATGYALTLGDASIVYADVVLSAVGLRPRIALARSSGLTVNRGIVVDNQLRSSDENIFALGDCAEIEGKIQPFILPIMHAGRALAKILNGENTSVIFPAMPVVVKTPAHPVAVSPVARDAVGAWQTLASGDGIKMGFFEVQNKLAGFVLTGEFAAERNEMSKLLAQ